MVKKKIVRLDFRGFWKHFSKKDNFFMDLLTKDYNVIIDEKNPDYVIFSVFEDIERRKGEGVFNFIRKTYLSWRFHIKKNIDNWMQIPAPMPYRTPKIKGNFVKIFYTGENVVPDMSKCDWAFSFMYDEEFKHPRHMRVPIYFSESFYENKLIKRKKDFSKQNIGQLKFCNFIYSNKIHFRNRFFKKLSKYKHIDSPGKVMKNIPNTIVPLTKDHRNHYGNKFKFLSKYKFTIAFENSVTEGYTTEKICHPMISGSIPIYFGNPLISRDFNPKSFINVRDFKNFDEAIKKIIEIDNNDELYYKMLKEPWFKENKKTKYFDENRLRERLREIFG